MSSPYLGQIMVVSFNFAPQGWALCNGQLLSIAQNTALFSLLGTQYGGDGVSNFALPDMQGCVAVGSGAAPGLSSYVAGQTGGAATHAVTPNEMASHTHLVGMHAGPATLTNPTLGVFAQPVINGTPANLYGNQSLGLAGAHSLAPTGANQPHDNMAPFLVMNFIIALVGVFPSRS
jgi:microcystin-dependent protein